MQARFDAALAQLKRVPQVDADKIAVIGYCFGGSIALAMARAGADLDAVAAFHVGLEPKALAQKGKVKARILVQAGAADPMIPPEQVEAFKKEMTAAGAKFEVISYPGAKHSFTNPEAGRAKLDGLAYDPEANRRSWDLMLSPTPPESGVRSKSCPERST